MKLYILEIWIWCHCILNSYFKLVSWWYGYQYLVWICMMTCWVYKLYSVVSGLYLQVTFIAWLWVVFAHWSFIIDTYLDLWIEFGLSMPLVTWFSNLSSCRRDEMLLPGTIMVEDCGWLFYADRLDILRARCSVHGRDHSAMDFGMTWLDI